jgi:hypothetical protein
MVKRGCNLHPLLFGCSVSSYVNAIFVNPATAGAHLNNLVSAYNKGTLASKKKFEDFFEILQEELIKYENDDNK